MLYLLPAFQMFLFTYNHPRFPGPHEKAEAMDRIKGILKEANFSGAASAFPFSKEYGAWETDLVSSHLMLHCGLSSDIAFGGFRNPHYIISQ